MFWCVNAVGTAVLYRVTPELCVWRKCFDVWMLWALHAVLYWVTPELRIWRKCFDVWMLWALQYCTELLQKIISVVALIVGWFWVWKHVWFSRKSHIYLLYYCHTCLSKRGPVVQNLKLSGNMALKFLSWNMANTLIYFAEKMWVALQKLLTFVQQKYQCIWKHLSYNS